MKKEIITLACAIGLFGSASAAFAGAYGDKIQPEESPAAAPAPVVAAEPEIDYAATGAYLGLGGQYAIELFDKQALGAGNSSGFHVEAGYRFHPNVAAELRYENYTEFDTDEGQNTEFRGSGHISGYSVTGNVKGFLLTGRFQPYVLMGLGYLNMDPDRTGDSATGDNGAFAMRFGGGMEAHITENISMGPEIAYMLPISGDPIRNLDFLTVGAGLHYNFR